MDKRSIESSENTVTKKCRRETSLPEKIAVEKDLLSIPSTSIPQDVLIPELPVEVVDNIFQFLSGRDRRNASLVCSKWNVAGSLRKYAQNEKLVFRGYQDFETLLFLLSRTKREFLNLEFQKCTFHDSSNLLSISEKIRFLSFRNCEFSDGFKIQLFVKCHNLKEFHHRYVATLRIHPNEPYFTSGFVASLVEKGFTNENLEILYLNAIGSRLNDEINSLLNMFLNIKTIAFNDFFLWDSCHFNYSDYCTSSLAQNIISKKPTLESLKIVGYENHLQLLESHDFPRLKKLSFRLQMEIGPDFSNFDFFVRLEYLEKLTLRASKALDSDHAAFHFPRFIVHLIHRCPHLKHLKLLRDKNCRPLKFDSETFQALVSSNLISIKMNATLKCYSKTDIYDQSFENKTLRVLRIPNVRDCHVQLLFLKHFKNLEVLELKNYSEAILDSIGQLQKNLTSLKVEVVRSEGEYYAVFQDDPRVPGTLIYQVLNCLRSLTNVESLDLRFLGGVGVVFNCDLVPPSVKYLRICVPTSSKMKREVLKNSLFPLKNKKELEAVYFKSECAYLTDLSTWLEICSSLKKLRFLCLHNSIIRPGMVTNMEDPFSETYKNLFKCCPSLRCLMQKTGSNHFRLFHYDQVDEKMKVVEKFDDIIMDDFMMTEKIAGTKLKFSF